MVLSKAQQYVISHLAQDPDAHVIKVWRDEDGSIRLVELDYNDDYKESGLDTISRATFTVLYKQGFIKKSDRAFADMECWIITDTGKLALKHVEK